MISYIGANKHHRQRKIVSRSTKRSEVQSTSNLSRGWMMRSELRCEGLVGRVAKATMARSIEGTRHMLVSRSWFSERGFPNGFPKYGFSIKIWFTKKWFPKIWFLNQKMVSQNMVSQSKYGFPKYGFSIKIW